MKKILKSIAYTFLVLLVCLCVYTFIVTDIMKKDYVNVFGYTYFVVKTGSMSGTLEVNDIIIVKIDDNPKVNDVITYINANDEVITHRLVRISGNRLIAQGDVNNAEDAPITKEDLIGIVKFSISPSFILKLLATFLILFIFLALINFESIVQKIILKDEKPVKKAESVKDVKKETSVKSKLVAAEKSEKVIKNVKNGNTNSFQKLTRTITIPEEIFKTKANVKKEDKTSGFTVTIPLNDVMKIQKDHDREIEKDDEIEILDFEEVIDVEANSVVTKELNNSKEREKELLEQVSNLLRIKNDTITTTRINKKWLVKFQYVYKLANIVFLGDVVELVETVNHPTFKEIYDYDLEKAGLYENLINKIYNMPIYIFLRILAFAILYNDEEFFDGVYKVMKWKIQMDKDSCFAEVKNASSFGKKQLKSLIAFMQKISAMYDNNNVFELERIEKYAKIKSYVNN